MSNDQRLTELLRLAKALDEAGDAADGAIREVKRQIAAEQSGCHGRLRRK